MVDKTVFSINLSIESKHFLQSIAAQLGNGAGMGQAVEFLIQCYKGEKIPLSKFKEK
jgi:hypothetical protein